jgi:hypothetical protein
MTPPRLATARNPDRRSRGRAAAAIAALMGRPLLPWQQAAADVLLEVDQAGRYWYRTVVISVQRQAGKTLLMGALEEHRALTVRDARVWHTAQTGRDAADWLRDEHVPMLAAGPLAGRFRTRMAQGAESVRWPGESGGILRVFPPTRDALHGKQSDLVTLDEAWALSGRRGTELMQAIAPTQATRPGAQVLIVSAAGTAESEFLADWLARARAAVDDPTSRVALVDYGIADDVDPTDLPALGAAHPAYGRTIDLEHLAAALDQLGPDEFARAYGNRPTRTATRLIPAELWERAATLDAAPGTVAFGFDAAPDRADAAIVSAGRLPDGRTVLEVVEHRPGGVAWLPERVADLVGRWRPAAPPCFDGRGPAGAAGDQLALAGVEVTALGARDYATACAQLLDGLAAGRIVHRRHAALDVAVAGAASRSLGDAWAWGRRASAGSISALVAATLALWALEHAPAPRPAPRIRGG